MDNYIVKDVMKGIIRTREAVRFIRRMEAPSIQRKYTLASWFQEHKRAAPTPAQKRQAYDDLIGQAENKRLRG